MSHKATVAKMREMKRDIAFLKCLKRGHTKPVNRRCTVCGGQIESDLR